MISPGSSEWKSVTTQGQPRQNKRNTSIPFLAEESMTSLERLHYHKPQQGHNNPTGNLDTWGRTAWASKTMLLGLRKRQRREVERSFSIRALPYSPGVLPAAEVSRQHFCSL